MTDTTQDNLVKRLDLQYGGQDVWMGEDPDGDYVSFEDYAALESKLAQQDDLVQAAVAAALREAAKISDQWIGCEPITSGILALITHDAQAALDRVVAAERERIATWLENTAACYSTKGGSLLPIHENSLGSHAGTIYAAAIRKGGE